MLYPQNDGLSRFLFNNQRVEWHRLIMQQMLDQPRMHVGSFSEIKYSMHVGSTKSNSV